MSEPLSRVQLFAAPWTAAHQAAWDSPGKNTGVGCHALLQGIFPTQGSNSCLLYLLHCSRIFYPLNHREASANLVSPANMDFIVIWR